jgi:hypothetical protein
MITKVRNIACVLCATFAFTACDGFLEILPMNEVVLENYWTEKNDVVSVLNSCYETLETEDCLVRMGVWGELRSDNLKIGTNVPNEINEILKENILPSNSMCSWARFYEAINRCNTVCHYAPQVQAIDPNYTESEMRANIAEATAIRALCYFYLIRTFRDVPYTTIPSIDDSQNYVLPATPFDVVVDTLITDLERVQYDAVRRYYLDDSYSAYHNSSKITRTAIHALLADLYLWKGDWDNCIKYCDLVLDFKRQQYEEMVDREGNVYDIALFGDIPMILEKPEGETVCGNSYTEIFGNGNSFESIFELYFANNQQQSNKWVDDYYGSSRGNLNGRLTVPDFLRKDVAQGTNEVFKKTDGRAYSTTETDNSTYFIRKYVYSNVSFTTQSINTEKDLKFTSSYNSYPNWIIYRLTDMMLIKAEALIQKGPEYYTQAFMLINYVNKRANDVTTTSRADTLKLKDYTESKVQMEELLLAERQREFMFEGKRWFDLVRIARRDGNNNRLVTLASRKYIENVNAIKIKLANPDIIYFPYAKSELKVNPLLKQNPAYGHDEDSELTTNK